MRGKWAAAALLAVAALGAPPAGVGGAATCPEGFHAHLVGDGDHEHGGHDHVGLSMDAVDRNGNGAICVRHVTPDGDIHVHIDDIAA